MKKILTFSLVIVTLSFAWSPESQAKAQKGAPAAKAHVQKAAAAKKPAPKTQARTAVRAPARAQARTTAKTARAPARSLASRPAARTRGRAPSNYLPQAGGGGMATVGGVHESDKPIEVTGQSRNLSMMLVLKNEKDKIDFVEVRRNFRKEIGNTQY